MKKGDPKLTQKSVGPCQQGVLMMGTKEAGLSPTG